MNNRMPSYVIHFFNSSHWEVLRINSVGSCYETLAKCSTRMDAEHVCEALLKAKGEGKP